ncbi:MFS transporter [Mycolicibacterium palauense]|uniref:MFS transporter n=1 Tax=Mycolicibacterium palauense TaxID=2034511 RepID=UPI000BFF1776|nr:MFS transporter [Mycolicibacterium palauense]
MTNDGGPHRVEDEPTPRTTSTRVGLYFGVLQLFFNLSWVIYVIFLPQLAAQAGIGTGAVPWILLMDQVVFVVCDWAAGLASDRVAEVLGKLGTIVAGITALSALAFLLLPFVTTAGPGVFLTLTMIWAVTSSALRAPPLKLLGRYTPPDGQPRVASLFLLGIGISTALAPFLAGWVTGVDPRIMFAASAVSVVVVTASIVWAEKTLARSAPTERPPAARLRVAPFLSFLGAILLLALAYQVHFFINSGPLFGRFAPPDRVEDLVALFWMGFSVAMLPASLLTKRFGGVAVMAAGAVLAAAAAGVAELAAGIVTLVAAQFVCGAAWGAVTMSAVATALRLGHAGSEGRTVGAMYSVMAAAAVARIAVVTGDLGQGSAPALTWLPVTAWVAAALLLVRAARRTPAPA